ncbi:energy transducer TonB [Spongiimicrobium salis]|uniref:energy transducer TonB n=1 Tax=Spongiimicrobium salis TaxID=1667022 RepID=UPI00374DAAE0
MPLFCLLCISCQQNPGTSQNTESELIKRINAVQNQMAKQGNISEAEKMALKSLASIVAPDENYSSQEDLKDAILFDEVDAIPVYLGCEELSQEESKQCFTDSFNSLIASEFNMDIPNRLEIKGPQSVEVFFMVNKDGTVSHRKVREPNVVILAEIVRVLKLMPKLKPGMQDGEIVNVRCAAIVHYGN